MTSSAPSPASIPTLEALAARERTAEEDAGRQVAAALARRDAQAAVLGRAEDAVLERQRAFDRARGAATPGRLTVTARDIAEHAAFVARCREARDAAREAVRSAARALQECDADLDRRRAELGRVRARREGYEARIEAARAALAAAAEARADDEAADVAAARRHRGG